MELAVTLARAVLSYRHRVHTGTRTVKVLDHFSFNVKRGEVVAILGSSGSGKSSLLRILSGTEVLQSGSISVLGTSPRTALRSGITAIASSDSALLPWRSAISNVRLPLDLLGRPRSPSTAKARELLDRLKIGYLERSRPSEMSEGESQRVRLAQALVTDPDLLLLDEPFNNADELLRSKLTSEVSGYVRANERRAGVIVTHFAHEAAALADRFVIVGGPPLSIEYSSIIDTPAPLRSPKEVEDITASLRARLLLSKPLPSASAA